MRALIIAVMLAALVGTTVLAQEAPRGKIIYSRAVGDGFRLHVMNADGSGDRELPNQTRRFNTFGAWSADGKRVAYTAFDDEKFLDPQVYLADADGGNTKQLPSPQPAAAMAAWSPDGAQLTFMAGDPRSTPPMAYVSDTLGNQARRLSREGAPGFAPFWSADGKSVCYTRGRDADQTTTIVRHTLASDAVEELQEVNASIAVCGPNALSPDGNSFVFHAFVEQDRGGDFRVYDIANRSISTLTELGGKFGERAPTIIPTACWAPDGKSLLLTLLENDKLGIFRVSLDGKEKTRLTPAGVEAANPAWWSPE
jgi:Tol biopolymer transport system component